MITCPLCQKEVLYNPGYVQAKGIIVNLQQETLEDNSSCDFFCPTFVKLFQGHSRSHYTRQYIHSSHLEYEIVMPPFQLIWNDRTQKLIIYDNSSDKRNWPYQIWKSYDNVSLSDALKIANQLNKMKAFI